MEGAISSTKHPRFFRGQKGPHCAVQGYHDLRMQIILQYLNNLGTNSKGAVQFPRLPKKRICVDPALKQSPATRYIFF